MPVLTSVGDPEPVPRRLRGPRLRRGGTATDNRGGIQWWAARITACTPLLLRVAVGVVFLGFGALKLFPSVSPAERTAVEAASILTLDLVPRAVLLPGLAVFEVAIGLSLITGWMLRAALVAFFLHMGGVFSTLVLLPDTMWQPGSLIPTMEGQYVVKNVILIVACLIVAADAWSRGDRGMPYQSRWSEQG
ncbi:DoxX family membrane protein [Streptomyces sp. NPDC088789]|uniref:DoxX family membrane protein n=1 Tax=Streptomyces sp. NPDC088789 TaxID=3365899 RepID=UPI003806D336